jgi:hypothetical protein
MQQVKMHAVTTIDPPKSRSNPNSTSKPLAVHQLHQPIDTHVEPTCTTGLLMALSASFTLRSNTAEGARTLLF